jgi:hypothetical protein
VCVLGECTAFVLPYCHIHIHHKPVQFRFYKTSVRDTINKKKGHINIDNGTILL